MRQFRQRWLLAIIIVVLLCGCRQNVKSLSRLVIDTSVIALGDAEKHDSQPTALTLKFKAIINELLSSNETRYYVYDNDNITRKDVRARVKSQEGATWPYDWGARFRDEYAISEVLWLEALEKHHLRTLDPSSADFILIPIPVCGLLTFATADDTRLALDTLFEEPLFKEFPAKHVIISLLEYLFLPMPRYVTTFAKHGWANMKDYDRLRRVTVVKDFDMYTWLHFRKSNNSSKWVGPEHVPMTDHGWSLTYSGEASLSKYRFRIPEYEEFQNRTFHFFYRTRRGESRHNSTQFRHAPVNQNVTSQFIQPSSIGHDIPPDMWLEHYADSKFCVVIRGDNPTSRSLWRSIRYGCLPVIVSDDLPVFGPVYRSFVNMTDYAIFVDETEFMADPAGSLNRASNLSENALRDRLQAFAMFQRLLIVDHPQSLFVEAFCRETMASQEEEYYIFSR